MAKMVLATFAETKVARLPGRNPAKSIGHSQQSVIENLSLGRRGKDGYPLTTAGMTEN